MTRRMGDLRRALRHVVGRWGAVVLVGVTIVACDEKGAAPPGGTSPTGTTTTTSDATTSGDTSTGSDAAGDGYGEDYTIPESNRPSVRRLSAHELARTYAAVVGVVPPALAEVPPDPRDHTFDRVVNAQTVSLIHVEAYDRAAREAAQALIGERRLDDLAPACGDALIPPAAPATAATTTGIGLAAYPDWALIPGDGDPDRLLIRYAPECGVSTSHGAPVDGTYRVALDVELVDTFDVTLSVDGAPVETWTRGAGGPLTLTWEGPLTAGTHLLAFDFVHDDSQNPYVWIQALTVTGPIDPAAAMVSERAACAEALVDALLPAAFRRPATADERTRLVDLYVGTLANGGTFAEAMALVLRAILGSPKFLYLIEGGTPVPDAPGRWALDDWAIAARLAYAVCEAPPDAELRARAAAGELQDGAVVRAEATRLFGLPCARETLTRFYRQWLWLERLPATAKDPAVYPEFTAATAASFLREADRFLEVATFEDALDLATLYTTRRSFVDAIGAEIYGLPAPGGAPDAAGLHEVTLPPERSGLLTLPGVLAVTSKFSQTSPVIRGVYVLEQILCDELPAPPDDVDTTPPALDPTATTRERWAAHSESGACRPCHQRIDPIGFTFEAFDATGRHRTSENGLPIDATGGAPVLDLDDGTLDGAASLAAAVAGSERATTCLARQWLRFSLGRLEEAPDGESVAAVAAVLRGPTGGAPGSLLDGFIALTGTRAFRERVERLETEETP